MNRVLKRPMFRRGGSTDQGITSGLRTGYNRGRVVNPGGYRGDDFGEKISTRYETIQELVDKYAPERKPSINDFLINTGLDLMSRPKAGGIFQQIATSAKEPLAKLQQQQEARDLMKERTTRAIIGDLVDYEAKVEAERAGATTGPRKEFEWESKYKELKDLRKQHRGLEDQIAEAEAMLPDEISPAEKQKKLIELRRDRAALETDIYDLADPQEDIIANMLQEQEDLETLAKYQDLKKRKHTMSDEVYQRELNSLLEGKAEGGRIGYQDAGSVQGLAPQEAAPQEAAQESPVQQLSFEELRARLPKSITNDIVRLLADSEQALVDFSSIRTQQDIDSFNQKYGVDLVMPPEV